MYMWWCLWWCQFCSLTQTIHRSKRAEVLQLRHSCENSNGPEYHKIPRGKQKVSGLLFLWFLRNGFECRRVSLYTLRLARWTRLTRTNSICGRYKQKATHKHIRLSFVWRCSLVLVQHMYAVDPVCVAARHDTDRQHRCLQCHWSF